MTSPRVSGAAATMTVIATPYGWPTAPAPEALAPRTSSTRAGRHVVEGATQSMLHAIHVLSLIMAVVPVAAIVLAVILLRPKASA